VDYKAVVFL